MTEEKSTVASFPQGHRVGKRLSIDSPPTSPSILHGNVIGRRFSAQNIRGPLNTSPPLPRTRRNDGARKKKLRFFNSRSFSTLTTKLSSSPEDGVGVMVGDSVDMLDSAHSADVSQGLCNEDSCLSTSLPSGATLQSLTTSFCPRHSTRVPVEGDESEPRHPHHLRPSSKPVTARDLGTTASNAMGSWIRPGNVLFSHMKTDSLGFDVDENCRVGVPTKVPVKDNSKSNNSQLNERVHPIGSSPLVINSFGAKCQTAVCNDDIDDDVFSSREVELSGIEEESVSKDQNLDANLTTANPPLMDAGEVARDDSTVSITTPVTDSGSEPPVFQFQEPYPVKDNKSTLKPAPFRRQLSKRKSESHLSVSVGDDDGKPCTDDSEDEDDFHSFGKRSCPDTPTSPRVSKHQNYDPYQYFEVQHTPCLILTVRVLKGRNITLGTFRDMYDTPDPFINLVMRTSPEGHKSTTVKHDEPNPMWDETFIFYVNFTKANVLEISLMEYNSIWFNQLVGTVFFDIVNINQMDIPQIETFVFNGVSQVDIEFKLEFDRNPTLRYSLCLSDAEKKFMERRKEKAMEGCQRLLGEEEGPLGVDEVPTIAVLGSGGGFRAMTGYCGVFKALVESGVLDCTTYTCGLSGSSWFLSTLYSHPKWPNLDMAEFQEELKNSVDKSLLRFLTPRNMYTYASHLIRKRHKGQPVSFTDIFGRMVGETLLHDRMNSSLTDQREKLKDGNVPMPLYTCVHVKKDVPARSFQEWVEFSPYEIGMPKYGTFMDSALFGSKFFMGKLVKTFDEQPLHFLQGIWGSAFCILFKRLLDDNRRIDPAEMIRRELGDEQILREELGQELEQEQKDSSSDCSDNEYSMDDSMDSSVEEKAEMINSVDSSSSLDSQDSQDRTRVRHVTKTTGDASQTASPDVKKESMETVDADSAFDGEEDDGYVDDDDDDYDMGNDTDGEEDSSQMETKFAKRKDSLQMKIAKSQGTLVDSTPKVRSSGSGSPSITSSLASPGLDSSMRAKKNVNWGSLPSATSTSQKRREAFQKTNSALRKSKSGSRSYWKQYLKGIFESNWELLSTRRGRAAVIHNFMRGLSLQQTYPLSPFTPLDQRVKEGDEFDGIFEMHSTSVKHIYMVDAGLTFNSPYPLILRPQREVDIILSFDFSARASDSHHPFKELLLAEKWAKLNRLPFPPINTSVFEKEGMKELYIFRHPTDVHCPVVFHFVLVNKKFRNYKKPGIPRQTKEEFDFAEFDIFDNPKAPYSTFNFTYTNEDFDKLSQLTEFNTLLHIEEIKQVMRDVIKKKRVGPVRVPIQSQDIKLLRMKSVQEYRKLRKFITRMESRRSLISTSTPSTPLFSAGSSASSNNPFFAGYHREISLESSTDSPVFATPRDELSESFLFGGGNPDHSPSRFMKKEPWMSSYPKSGFFEKGPRCSRLSSSSSIESVYGTPPSTTSSLLTNSKQHTAVSNSPFSDSSQLIADADKLSKENWNSGAFYQLSPKTSLPSSPLGLVSPPDMCDGQMENGTVSETVEQPCVNGISVVNGQIPAQVNTDYSNQNLVCNHPELPLTTANLSQHVNMMNKSPGSSPKLKIANPALHMAKEETTSSQHSGQVSASSTSTPDTGNFIPKGKPKKDLPPNPFFANAHFMRSAYNSSSSSGNSSAGLGPIDIGRNYRRTQGLSYRLDPRITNLQQTLHTTPNSHLAKGSHFVSKDYPIQSESAPTPNTILQNVPVQNSSDVQILNPDMTSYQAASESDEEEEFILAPEAFKSDGTPVMDSKVAKMYYERANQRRKMFRRQSTVSSLNSISLEEQTESTDEPESPRTAQNSFDCDCDLEQDSTYTPNYYRNLFLSTSCSSDSSISHNEEHTDVHNTRTQSPSGHQQNSDGIQTDVLDICQFQATENIDKEGGKPELSPPKCNVISSSALACSSEMPGLHSAVQYLPQS